MNGCASEFTNHNKMCCDLWHRFYNRVASAYGHLVLAFCFLQVRRFSLAFQVPRRPRPQPSGYPVQGLSKEFSANFKVGHRLCTFRVSPGSRHSTRVVTRSEVRTPAPCPTSTSDRSAKNRPSIVSTRLTRPRRLPSPPAKPIRTRTPYQVKL